LLRQVIFMCVSYLFFFFSSRRRHTRFSRDWSSDVCSSDLELSGSCPAVVPTVVPQRRVVRRCSTVDLYEYQARDIFAAHGVPVLPGSVAATPEEARAAAEKIGGQVVVKAQVKNGGRGKAGGVKLADNPDEAREKAEAILGLDIKGHITRKVLVAQASDIAEEYYFSFLLDRANRTFLCIASAEGGV